MKNDDVGDKVFNFLVDRLKDIAYYDDLHELYRDKETNEIVITNERLEELKGGNSIREAMKKVRKMTGLPNEMKLSILDGSGNIIYTEE